jgi:acetylornithine/N-succinyldiaminopimelate aminotransferase
MTTAENLAQFVLPTYARFPLELVRGEGAQVWDGSGRRYLDFCCGIAVCSIGHCHPRLVAAITEQAGKLMHVSNLYQIPQQAELARTLVEDFVKLPGKVFFSNSGAEANDGLIKVARRFGNACPGTAGPRYEVITFRQSFHGRTLGSMAATGQDKIKEGFDPMLPGFRHLPFGDAAALEAAISEGTVAVLLEPIQGEGGIREAGAEFLRAVAKICRDHNLLLMLDEVQCGFGRTGDAMAWRSFAPELEPDCVSWAKGMGGGFPIGAFWVSDRTIETTGASLSSLMGPGSHGSTYGGNPLACAASLAVLAEIQQANLAAHAKAMEQRVRAAVATWTMPAFHELRGKGLLLGFGLNPELIPVPAGKTPALVVVSALTERGLLTVPAGPDTVRWLPPLNVTAVEIDEALAIMHDGLSAVAS